jgi:hypothetical protein
MLNDGRPGVSINWIYNHFAFENDTYSMVHFGACRITNHFNLSQAAAILIKGYHLFGII